jgi:hypothetical protein
MFSNIKKKLKKIILIYFFNKKHFKPYKLQDIKNSAILPNTDK